MSDSLIRKDLEPVLNDLFTRLFPSFAELASPRPFKFGDILRYCDPKDGMGVYRFLYVSRHPAPEAGYGIILDGPVGVGEVSSFVLANMEVVP